MMKVTCVLGSPLPRGNSSVMAEAFLKGMERSGGEIRKVELNTLTFRGCQACMGCKKGAPGCVQKDDLFDVLKGAAASDVVVLASGVYAGNVTASVRGFIERFGFSFYPAGEETLIGKGKKMVLILSQGAEEAMHKDLPETFKELSAFLGFDAFHVIRACGMQGPGEVLKDPEMMELVDRTVGLVLN